MKALYTALAACVVIAFASDYILHQIGFSSQDRQSGAAVRLGDAAE
ncbi:hypothetical protein [Marivita sp.]|nr:hypothetical protein [Marivita sp.]HKL55253.1 hypothetical protein [Roseovarius sp.]